MNSLTLLSSNLKNAIFLLSGDQLYPLVMANSSSYTQSVVPFIILFFSPSNVICLISPFDKSLKNKLLSNMYETFVPSGEYSANV